MPNSFAELLVVGAFLFLELISDGLDLWNASCNTKPGDVLQSWVAFPVKAKVRIVLSFDEPISPFQTIATPGLDGKWLVEVVIMARLLEGFLDLRLNCFR